MARHCSGHEHPCWEGCRPASRAWRLFLGDPASGREGSREQELWAGISIITKMGCGGAVGLGGGGASEGLACLGRPISTCPGGRGSGGAQCEW